MGRYYLDDDEKKIIRAVVRLDNKRRRGKLKRRETHFDRKAAAAIEEAERSIELGGTSGEIRDAIIEKIRENIISGTTWERIGDTYCGRDTFYRYSRRYQYLIARNMGIVEDSSERKERGSNGERIRKGLL